jgi:outer membrane immunogenic protein
VLPEINSCADRIALSAVSYFDPQAASWGDMNVLARIGAAVVMASTFTVPCAVLADGLPAAPYGGPSSAPFSWTGFYIGGNVGASWTDNSASYSQVSGNGAFSTGFSDTSAIGGGQIGFNWQRGPLVIGLEADIAGRSSSSADARFPFGGDAIDEVVLSQRENWLGTVRPRVGVAWGPVLVYATGGLAYGDAEYRYTEDRVTVPGQLRSLSVTDTQTGWTVGGGVEWALSRNWSFGAEYLHVDLGTTTLNLPAQTVGGLAFPPSAAHFEDHSDIVRAKLNYRFGEDRYVPLK